MKGHPRWRTLRTGLAPRLDPSRMFDAISVTDICQVKRPNGFPDRAGWGRNKLFRARPPSQLITSMWCRSELILTLAERGSLESVATDALCSWLSIHCAKTRPIACA